MNPQLEPASSEQRSVFENLMQFYKYDFTEYTDEDLQEQGLFETYPNLTEYWVDEACRFPFLIRISKKLVGFVLVKKNRMGDKEYFSVGEFFVLKKYRRQGIGNATAKQVFDQFKGSWEVHQHEKNLAAQAFWKRVIAEYTNGNFTNRIENGKRFQTFESR